ncbi:adenylyl-sulfate kinase [Staphylococcus pettenkoferi]|uniref:adenylyl-sulfate kinase n=1 Tax=Staphylococcus pettenkoferi TaxID=170573 RepID=UPI000F524C9D|nr:adenylyl-sulfate kinase [Staphylococcus pettenkoferi]MCY1565082.1 adenylyl-sulfate kinase [Staphylococcus pettenkoferi]MCY1572715.1 adenylyl-sulfate kinase [Staphylococcus pettenkoferi]MCY1606874.1 adenylyl-sulfate kinase [Staphylococcus pettenkoferi]MDH9616769.1 adenylyl-sulfate kinase [Staphylococcus pettenkoferi]RQN00040.1 adenylyl-sulfate kinase [Staphylococcus pettenkoferi]
MGESTNITWHDSEVTKQDRQQLHGHKSATLWFTGLSGSDKSTISVELEKALFERKKHAFRLDGDNVRHGLNKNLGFSPEDRQENIRRIGEVSKLMVDAGLITITAFISPYREDRDNVRAILDDDEFIEIYTQCSVEECERRDPKGLYKKARTGEIPEFTGISAPYEEPRNPEITIDTEQLDVKDAVTQILNYLEEHQYI